MNLTTFDHDKGCSVLNPEAFPTIINAFHPDYIKTYHPEMLSSIRTEVKKVDLKPKDYFTFQKAGMPKGVK